MRNVLCLAVVLINALLSYGQHPVDVTEQTIKIGRMQEEVLYFGFAEGDQIIFNFSEMDNRELKEIEIVEYPSHSKFSDYKTSKVANKTFQVLKNGVYKFRFTNSAITGRICQIKIQRIPASDATKSFNTHVTWMEKQDTSWNSYTKDIVAGYDTTYVQSTKTILVKTEQREELLLDKVQRVHSTSNENGNKSSLFFTLPKREALEHKVTSVIAWAYWVGVGEESNRAWRENAKTITTVAKGAAHYFATPLGALALGAIADLTIPKIGEDVAYGVTDIVNRNLFLAGQPYRGFDFGKGVAGYKKFDRNFSQGSYAICLSNDNLMQGIDVTVKVVAILETNYFEDQINTEQKVVPRYEKRIFKDPIIQKVRIPVSMP